MTWKFFTKQGATVDEEVTIPGRPAGSIIMWHSTTAPTGWLRCNGTTVSQATYSSLFSVIGGSYNIGGEAAGTFRLPNLNDVYPRGTGTLALASKSGTLTHSHTGLAHTHNFITNEHQHSVPAHAHSVTHGHIMAWHTHGAGSYSVGAAVGGETVDGDNIHGVAGPNHSHPDLTGNLHPEPVDDNGNTVDTTSTVPGSSDDWTPGGLTSGPGALGTGAGVIYFDNNTASPVNHEPPHLPFYFIIKT